MNNQQQVIQTDEYYIRELASGYDEVVFNISIWDELYPQLVEEAAIRDRDKQWYLIKQIDGGTDTAKIVAQLDLDVWKTSMLIGYSNNSATLDATITGVLPAGWSLVDNTGLTIRRTIEGDYTPLEVVEACRDTYGVYFRFDNVAQTITVVIPDAAAPLGSFATRDLNLKEINYKGKSTTFATRLYAYGADGLSFASINDGKPYVDNNTYSDKVACAVWKDDRYTVAENLLEDATAKLAVMAKPDRSYDCDVVDLRATNPEMYGFLDFEVFSVATLIDDAKGFSINYQVVERWDYPYYPEKNKVIFSSSPAKIQSQVTQISNAINNPNSPYQQQQQAAINNATNWITNGKGYMVAVHDADGNWIEQCSLDQMGLENATKVWRWNNGGFGFSSSGYNGPYTVAITQDGAIVADFITTGTLNAALVNVINLIATNITSGTLQSKDGTTFYLDLDNGILRMNASEFTVSGRTVQQIADASSSAAAQQVAQQAQENLENYAETVTADLTSLQSQIDGQIMTFFYDYLPTSDNVPASEWTTDAEKQQHLGDLFYVVDNAEYGGQAYRWAQVNGAYQWILIEDTAVAQALEQSAQALDTADSKRRVFVAQPVPPYDVGDLWSQGPSGSLMVCCNARSSGSYLASDWQSSADYINSQQASAIAGNAVAAQTQTDIFNKLTNNGQLQGLYMQNGQLYINASYMNTGTLSAVKIQSQDGSSYWDLAGGGAVFNNNSIRINSENFSLDGSGNVSITGDFFAQSSMNKVAIRNGSISFSRFNSSVNDFRGTVSVWSTGTTGPFGVVSTYGPDPSGNAVLNAQIQGGYSGGSLFICDATGQVKLSASIDGSGNSYIDMGGTGKITTQTLEVGYIKANGQTYRCGWIYNTTVGYNMLCAI